VEAATALSGHRLLLPVAALPPLKGLKFYYHEVVGFALEDERFGSLGTIATVMDLPGNPLFKTALNESEGFFPIKDETLVSVNREAKTIVVSMPEGLPELYFDNAAL
jgi:16S rRNA processing protein RimM